MPEIIRGRPTVMRCVFESAIRNFKIGAKGEYVCFKLVHDGSKPTPDCQANDTRFFTREYQLWLDGEPVRAKIEFKYDYRTGKADFSIGYADINVVKEVMVPGVGLARIRQIKKELAERGRE